MTKQQRKKKRMLRSLGRYLLLRPVQQRDIVKIGGITWKKQYSPIEFEHKKTYP